MGDTRPDNEFSDRPVRVTVLRRLTMSRSTQRFFYMPRFGPLVCRTLSQQDDVALGRLIFRSFQGTVDDRGDTEDDWIKEARKTLRGNFGPISRDASLILFDGNKPVCAAVVTVSSNASFLVFAMTDPSFRKKGLAESLIRQSMTNLHRRGVKVMRLCVTEENVAALNMYKKLGFKVESDFYHLKVTFPNRINRPAP